MTIQLSTAVRNARLDAIEATVGAAPILRFYTGSMPANNAAAATGTLVGAITLPSNWAADASSGSKGMAGSWSAAMATGGDIGYFRILDSGGSTCHIQGTAGTSGTDMIIDNDVLTAGQTLTVTAFNLTDGNA